MGRRSFIAVTVFALLAASCGASRPLLDEDGVAREVVPATTAGGTSSQAPDVSGSLGQSTDRITVRLAVPIGWSDDPADAGPASISNRVIADLLYEGLTTLDFAGEPSDGLAERWETGTDRLAWTFVLPAGLTDGQGRRVTASDVAASLNRTAMRGPADQAATALTAVTGWSDVMNGDAPAVSGIVTVDATTLRIGLDQPFELLPFVLASPAFGIAVLRADGSIGTTGRFAPTADPTYLRSVDPESAVGFVQMVEYDGDVMPLVADRTVDWAVVPPGELVDDLPGDVIREPLDMRLGFAVRLPKRSERVAVGRLLDPVALADAVEGLSALATPAVEGPFEPPAGVVVDAPAGRLADAATEAVSELNAGGVPAEVRVSSPSEFAARVVSGEALVYPVMIAGGTGAGGDILRSFAPGGVDATGSATTAELDALVERARSDLDPASRDVSLAALERSVVATGVVTMVGRWEVTVAIGTRLSGLRQRVDGTLDMSRAQVR